MSTVAIVQCRMGSTRFPGKVMRPICGTPMIEQLLQRLSKSRLVDQIVVATTTAASDDALADHVGALGYGVYRGSTDNVLDRYHGAAQQAGATTVIRITGDCPLVDPDLVDAVIAARRERGVDYASNTLTPTFPDGMDVEVFSFEALDTARRDAADVYDREHVTPYIKRHPSFSRFNVDYSEDLSAERWTVDEPEDLAVITRVFEHFHPDRAFAWTDVLTIRQTHPEWFAANQKFKRNAGAKMGTGQKLWQRAKRVIPGGNMLLSKRSEMFLPEKWPSYFSRAKGVSIWDMDGQEFLDTAFMGIGTNTLGYGHPEVDDAVRGTIDAGNMTTLNCPEEVWLAERLVELHPWADMVRFARSGGEANAIAVRIARAAAGRDVVAVCGYHGWHDWYLASNLGDSRNLDGHLLPGLEPNGVPRNLRGSVATFRYNHFEELLALVETQDIGVVKMEVMRNEQPKDGFLEKVRDLCTDKGIVLVFDECTSGFRETYGGLHKKYGVEPDVAVFGKALGNGYAITGVIGRREVMDAAQTTFISSTFWTERIGPTAGLKTLEVMERERSWETIEKTGKAVIEGWTKLAQTHGIDIAVSGLPAIAAYGFKSDNRLKYKTLVTQEMLKQGLLATTAFYTSTAHTPEIVDRYFNTLDPIYAQISRCEAGELDIDTLLEGPVCQDGFKRLN